MIAVPCVEADVSSPGSLTWQPDIAYHCDFSADLISDCGRYKNPAKARKEKSFL
jgi:hypothetical protein